MHASERSVKLIAWYDRHHRALPWRVSPPMRANGTRPDPYRVWLSEIMLQQTTVATVKGYYDAFPERWPDGGAMVTVYDPASEEMRRVRVEVGLNNNINAEIVSGLEEGDLVVNATGARLNSSSGGPGGPGGFGGPMMMRRGG